MNNLKCTFLPQWYIFIFTILLNQGRYTILRNAVTLNTLTSL